MQFSVAGQTPKQRATDRTDGQYWYFHSEFMGQPQAEKHEDKIKRALSPLYRYKLWQKALWTITDNIPKGNRACFMTYQKDKMT